jgi:hypothetical protein
MTNLLTSAVERFRASRVGQKLFPTALSPEELRLRVERGLRIVKMLETDGWRDYQESVRNLIRAKKDGLCALSPTDFQSAQGLQSKGEIVGAQAALNQVMVLVMQGTEAERKLNEMELPEAVRNSFLHRPKGKNRT